MGPGTPVNPSPQLIPKLRCGLDRRATLRRFDELALQLRFGFLLPDDPQEFLDILSRPFVSPGCGLGVYELLQIIR
jgi:hypothetical protein